ncbi:MAG: hypothetical protein PHT92_03275 [Bacteroidales bacterium]|nr:hypothetical protein [Bacteroidales bacterium]
MKHIFFRLNMCRVDEVYTPIPENSKVYNDIYNKGYRKLYKRLKPLYENIREITNYPQKSE